MPELDENQLKDFLKQKLAEQDELRKRFDQATPYDECKDEIKLGEEYKSATEFRMDREAFLVKHTPTELLNQWSAMTGPRRLRDSVEGWVNEIHTTFPPKAKTE